AVAALDATIAEAVNAITALTAEQHHHEKNIVGHDAQLARLAEDTLRLARKAEVIGLERRQAEEERAALDARTAEGQQAISSLEEEQRGSDARLSEAQRNLLGAKEAAVELNDEAGTARAAHAGLLERAAALSSEVLRLREAAGELEDRIAARSEERRQT